ncbi:MAG: HipA domain-containing protein [Proteobacteria bacterium]|nr:HipA domain-containing protein [Pseudomonadota bacterium]
MSTSIRYLRLIFNTIAGSKRPIGYLSQYGDILRVSFDDDYVNDAQRPTLSLSYRGQTDRETQQILRAIRDVRVARSDGRWPTYFQNLLPEGHNRERLAAQRHCSPDDEFELLAAAGRDLMGAVEVEPIPLSEGIPNVVRHWHTSLGLDVLESGFVETPVEDAASLPGVVTKFSAVLDGRRYVVKRHGAAGDFILKLPSTRHPDLVQNEAFGYKLAKALGLNTAQAEVISCADAELPEVVPFDDILAVKRFDRAAGGRRIHMEEFAQVLQYEPRQKYGRDMQNDFASVLLVLDRLSSRPAQDVLEFVRRFVMFILMGNTDAHLKNWAVIYPDGVTPELAPLYDPVCVAAFFDEVKPNDYGINRAVDAKLRTYTWDDLDGLLARAGLQRRVRLIQQAKAMVKQAQSDWPALLMNAPANMRKVIQARLNGGVKIAG